MLLTGKVPVRFNTTGGSRHKEPVQARIRGLNKSASLPSQASDRLTPSLKSEAPPPGMVLFPIRFGVVSYTIRILMYPDVSRVYPVEYMYPGCILMYLKCILNALLHSKRIHVS